MRKVCKLSRFQAIDKSPDELIAIEMHVIHSISWSVDKHDTGVINSYDLIKSVLIIARCESECSSSSRGISSCLLDFFCLVGFKPNIYYVISLLLQFLLTTFQLYSIYIANLSNIPNEISIYLCILMQMSNEVSDRQIQLIK